MEIGAVIIARYNSSRLYGKVLKKIHNKVALEHTYDRLRLLLDPSQIIIATSSESTDDPIEKFANSKGWNLHRGSLNNVAQRFSDAGEKMNWDYQVRVNGDNIFIDLACFEEMINAAKSNEFDFLSNVKNRTFPKGMSIEIVRTKFYSNCLEKINQSEAYQEHVTLALYEEKWGNHRYFYNTNIKELEGVQLALDTMEDFERIDELITILGDQYKNYTLTDIKRAYEQLER